MARKLASIQRIRALGPIPGADAIERATVLGWELVVKRGEFKVGDLCVYSEIDSVMPERPEFEFLRPRNMRIKTVKLRGQVSQGICFSCSILPPGFEIVEGTDVTEVLGVTKYEPPLPANLAGSVKGSFPGFVPKTDEPRVQTIPEVLEKYQGELCYLTEKLDGTSVTYYLHEGEFGVCSRNLELLETPENTLWRVARELDLESKLRAAPGDFALQGELIGEGVQSNKYKLHGQAVRFYNVFDIQHFRYLDFAEFRRMLTQLGLESVPLLNESYLLTGGVPQLVELSQGRSALADLPREGIVIRPVTEKRDSLGRVSFKVVNPQFLLKYE